MLTKICSKCGEELQATNEYFTKSSTGKYGLSARCKKCDKIYRDKNKERIQIKKKEWVEKNKEHVREYKKRYREENKEYVQEQIKTWLERNKDSNKQKAKEYYLKNREEKLSKAKEYRENNKEKIKIYKKEYELINKEYIREYKKRYREENKEKIAKQQKEYYKKNKIERFNYLKRWYKDNPDKKRMYSQRREALKKNVASNLNIEQWEAIKKKFNYRCAYCGGENKLEQEHFIPLHKGGEYTINNIIPACKSCNCSKQDKNFFEWYPKQEFYSEDREDKILSFLNYSKDEQQLKILI
jgi:hypothetical protein